MRKKKSFSHLSLYEREQIFVHKRLGKPIREIARLIGRNHGTVSRELKRNAKPHPLMSGYVGSLAHEQARSRKSISGKRTRLKDPRIRDYVVQQMKLGWTPEIIAHTINDVFKDLSISHEAIYQYIYSDWEEGINYLPRKHSKRFIKGYKHRRNRCQIPNRVGIEQRPEKINQREEIGHWESDTVESDQSRVVINVVKERLTRFVKITRLENKTAALTKDNLIKKLGSLPQHLRKSITYDNGSENYHHEQVNTAINTKSYFCQPYHSWEKGAVEQVNGLIRRFIPKKTDLALFSQEQLDHIEHLLNHRPRKCLNFKTPQEVFLKLCGASPP
jgi:transposase, IS30 family